MSIDWAAPVQPSRWASTKRSQGSCAGFRCEKHAGWLSGSTGGSAVTVYETNLGENDEQPDAQDVRHDQVPDGERRRLGPGRVRARYRSDRLRRDYRHGHLGHRYQQCIHHHRRRPHRLHLNCGSGFAGGTYPCHIGVGRTQSRTTMQTSWRGEHFTDRSFIASVSPLALQPVFRNA